MLLVLVLRVHQLVLVQPHIDCSLLDTVLDSNIVLNLQKPQITGSVEKVVGEIVCKENHNLGLGDQINVSVTPGITTTYNVEYNDASKRTIINPKSFTGSNVSTTNNTITILDHDYNTGDKVVYISTSAASPLINNDTYFVYRVDKNTIKLCKLITEH